MKNWQFIAIIAVALLFAAILTNHLNKPSESEIRAQQAKDSIQVKRAADKLAKEMKY